MKERQLEVGDPIIFIDNVRRSIPALVQAVHGDLQYREGELIGVPCINLVLVSRDTNRIDSYGRQIEHVTSVCHVSSQSPSVGFCWHWPDEAVVIDEANVQTKR